MTVSEFQQYLKDTLAASHYMADDAEIATGTIYEDGPVIQLASTDKSHTQFMFKCLDTDINQWCSVATVFGDVKIVKYDQKEEEEPCGTMENDTEEMESCEK